MSRQEEMRGDISRDRHLAELEDWAYQDSNLANRNWLPYRLEDQLIIMSCGLSKQHTMAVMLVQWTCDLRTLISESWGKPKRDRYSLDFT